MKRISWLKPYDRKYGWGTLRSFYGLHTFAFGGQEETVLHLWPLVIVLRSKFYNK